MPAGGVLRLQQVGLCVRRANCADELCERCPRRSWYGAGLGAPSDGLVTNGVVDDEVTQFVEERKRDAHVDVADMRGETLSS